MASSSCWKCLSRPNTTLPSQLFSFPIALRPKSFSTTVKVLAAPVKGGAGSKGVNAQRDKAKQKSASPTLKIKKKAFVKTGKPPAPGERKAMRKRIVLSNTNALEVEGLEDLDAAAVQGMLTGERKRVVGSVVGLRGETVDCLRALEAFKTTQGWGLFKRPAMLVREEGAALVRKMIEVGEEPGKALRLVVDGDRVTGKSMVLLHAMACAFVRGWVVINIPEGMYISPLVKMRYTN
jgi:small subunit ribosomal protein S29